MRREAPPFKAHLAGRRLAVILATIVVLLAAIAVLPTVTTRLSTGGWLPADSEAIAVDTRLASEFNRRATGHLVLLTPDDPSVSLEHVEARRELARITHLLGEVPGVTGVYSPLNAPSDELRSRLVSEDGTKWLVVIQVEEQLQETVARLPEIGAAIRSDLFDAQVTGVPVLSNEFATQVKDDLFRAEMIALPIALLFLIRFAGGWRAAMAILITTLTSLAATTVIIGLASHQFTISIFALSTTAMLTIALSLDFGLLSVLRRGERESSSHTRATITIAAIAVIAGMAGITLLPVEAARSIGIVGAIGIVSVVLSQRFVLPTWLSVLDGDRGEAPRSVPTPSRWLRLVGRHPLPSLLLGVLVLAPLIAPVVNMRVVGPDVGLLPASSAATQTLKTVATSFPAISASPISIIASPADGSMLDARNLLSLKRADERIGALPGVTSVVTVWDLVPDGISPGILSATLALDPSLVEQAQPLLTGRGAVIEVVPTGSPSERAELVELLRAQGGRLSDWELHLDIGGADAASIDLVDSVGAMLLPTVATVLLAMTAALMIAFRSVVLPIKAILLNALPVLTGLGIVTLLFQEGSPWSVGTGTTVIVIPMILAWLMYGVSMDYEVFMLARIREHRERGLANDVATLSGVEGARAVVSRGAILMGIVFLAFSTSEVTVIRAIGVGLLSAIVVDATIVRLVLLPASMVLLGKSNWWWPRWLPARPMVEPPYLHERAATGDGR